ncbi:cyclophilin-like fold protein [Pedobacter heparinus]|uniref:Cyclophilin-like domain-containing protein n=1 Tax=Pedobacter heparinus (strain ATCC 13125 / DSM 2366 / CIP 104194 / JCM 7457 / NBRC 12017 / NCIMB 9290 / NRRL B-14731 / HIM 762-3) TaxID=485917 RepID=C6Y3D7_PEDHD|nr:cyclophilin-like fold protein [Pedobacter heparinus]ACU05362.1 conserved hypothetical protein [Pedobacter heparinus DSM 2366]
MKMKALILALMIGIHFSACSKDENSAKADNPGSPLSTNTTKMKITIGSSVFTATLYDNPTATAFKARLPLTINMTELNGNEKYYDFPSPLPTNASVGGNIKVGDLMLYGNNVLVLFYKNFNTSYSYTKLGYVDNPTGLAISLGTGNVVLKFENN